jgi:hypothetical protein
LRGFNVFLHGHIVHLPILRNVVEMIGAEVFAERDERDVLAEPPDGPRIQPTLAHMDCGMSSKLICLSSFEIRNNSIPRSSAAPATPRSVEIQSAKIPTHDTKVNGRSVIVGIFKTDSLRDDKNLLILSVETRVKALNARESPVWQENVRVDAADKIRSGVETLDECPNSK